MFPRHLSTLRYFRVNKDIESIRKPITSYPQKAVRTSTVFLETLQFTVRRDPSAVPYKYQDDPYLMPCSNLQKRAFAMSEEGGRKASSWFLRNHPKLFKSSLADPWLQGKIEYAGHLNYDEQYLELLIRYCDVNNAVKVYEHLHSKHFPITDSVKKSLLLLVCSYNGTEPVLDFSEEERCFEQNLMKSNQKKQWKNVEIAESLFEALAPDAQSYAALIRRLCEHCQFRRPFALFQEALGSKIDVDSETYNALISAVIFEEPLELHWEICLKLLNIMNTRKISPNLSTMNSLLSVIAHNGNMRLREDITLKILGEFNSMRIEPSLATYYYLLVIFCRRSGPVSYVIRDVLRMIKDKAFLPRHMKDTYFFVTAMDVAYNHLHDHSVAYRIHKLLHHAKNYELIGDPYKESIYYRNFLAILCEAGPFADFMEVYKSLVPNVYTPEPGIMETILKALKNNSAIEYLPELWSHVKAFDHAKRVSIMHLVVQIIAEYNSIHVDSSQRHFDEHFNLISWDIFKRLEEYSQEHSHKTCGSILGSILQVLSLGNDLEKARLVFAKLKQFQPSASGTPNIQHIIAYIDMCIAHGSLDDALEATKFKEG